MAKVELLTKVLHANLEINLQALSLHNSAVSHAMLVPSEFVEAQREFPIFFRKNVETGHFFASAMLGFENNENLFVGSSQWLSKYIPLSLAKGPFFIGYQKQKINDVIQDTPVIYVDTESSSLQVEPGERLFDAHGENTEALDRLSSMLGLLEAGVRESAEMFAAFSRDGLIEPLNLNIQLNNGKTFSLSGLYTIDEDKLSNLSAEALALLNRSGFLRHAFTVINSINNVKKLIDIKSGGS